MKHSLLERSRTATRGADISAALDTDRVREYLSEKCDFGRNVRLDGVQLERLWAGRRGRVTMEYALTLSVDGTRVSRLLQAGFDDAVTGDTSTGAVKLRDRWIDNLCLTAPDLGVTFVSPDRDHALASPRDVANSAVSQRLGDHLGIDIHDDAQGRYGADLVSYRVNKRFVLRSRGRDQKGNRTFIKALRRQISSESLQFWRRTARRLSAGSSGRVGFPRIIAVDVNQRWYAIEGKENGARPFGYDARDGGEAARLLSMIHRLSPCRLKEHSVFDEMEILGRWTKVMRAFGRSDSNAMTSLVAELVNRAGRIDPRPHVLVHRDFYASQLLAEGERTWLLDYDTFAAGDPEVDVATYLAHLVLDRVLAGAAENVMGELPAFLDTYQSMGGLIDPECLRIYLASALARMAAIHGFRRLESSQIATFWAVVWEVVNRSGARMSNANKKKRLAI